jgi:hypothetical protein
VPDPGRDGIVARRAGALLVALLALAGCSREPRFVPEGADSVLATGEDAFAEQVRVVQQQWAGAEGGPETARLSAELLLTDLRARVTGDPAGAWEARARELLDSLGIGAECAGAAGALGVNFFSRSDPSAGSWPWLFWNDAGTIRAQAIEGRGMSLVALASRGLADTAEGAAPAAPPAIAGLFSRRAGGGSQPLVMVWLAARGLEQTQTLGPDSLGGVGSGAFEGEGTHAPRGPDAGTYLATRTWRPTPRFDECSTCPHVVHERRFRWELEGFRCVEDRVVPSPYVAFVAFIHALGAGDHDAALRCVTRPELVGTAQEAGWAVAKGPWRAAPGQADREDQMIFYRGPREAWKVGFDRGPDGWRVDGIMVVPRVIE